MKIILKITIPLGMTRCFIVLFLWSLKMGVKRRIARQLCEGDINQYINTLIKAIYSSPVNKMLKTPDKMFTITSFCS